jgi:transcriptional regulator with XRE-family HTH domain
VVAVTQTSPTVSRRWLALEMRRLREERNLSQRAVAKALGCQVPKVSLLENAKRPLQEADLKTLLELFKVPTEDHQQYFDELQNAHEKGWWEFYDEDTVPEWYGHFIGLEQGADRIRAYQPAIIHGLLQTAEYASEIYRDNASGGLSEEKVARLVEVRNRRQRRLREAAIPAPQLLVVLDEVALRRVVGSREIMQGQLEHVVELCEARENVTVQVVPFDRGGAYEATLGAFTILGFPFVSDPGTVYRERRSGADFLDSLLEIDDHSLIFGRLSERLALSARESLEMIRETAESYGRPQRGGRR